MSLSTVLFLFLAHLGVGIVFTLVFVSRDAGVKFFRFNSGLAAILLVIALAFGFQWPQAVGRAVSATVPYPRALDITIWTSFALLVCAALTIFSWATVGRLFTRMRTAILIAAATAGLIALVTQ